MTPSSSTFQFACGSSVTFRPSSAKKPFSLATASGAMSVSLMKPSFSAGFSTPPAAPALPCVGASLLPHPASATLARSATAMNLNPFPRT
jgi:hypothetical protein